ncbi:MAG: IclR family transcriptional regulator, partial [Chloroflexi bacterium]|nr:IclR family transcriptional regulator [Chloroflexota bacterium]
MFPVLDASLSGNHQEVLLPMEAWPTRPSRRLSGSVGKAFQILAAFSVQRPELTASQIAAEIGMDRSTTHRFLTTLLDIGAVVRDPATRRYGLGLPLLGYACVLSNTLEVRRIALSHLHELHRDLEATVSLGVRDGAEVVLVERQSLAGPWVPPGGIEIGFRFPMHASATGLAILAFLAPDEIEGALRGLELKARTPAYAGYTRRIGQTVAEIRRVGYATSDEELHLRLRTYDPAAPYAAYPAEWELQQIVRGSLHKDVVLDEQLDELLPIRQPDGRLPGARSLNTGTRTGWPHLMHAAGRSARPFRGGHR